MGSASGHRELRNSSRAATCSAAVLPSVRAGKAAPCGRRLAGSSREAASALFCSSRGLRRGPGRCRIGRGSLSAARRPRRVRECSMSSAKYEAEEALEHGVHLLRHHERAEMPRTDGPGDHQPGA
jgi:hypothetical protein